MFIQSLPTYAAGPVAAASLEPGFNYGSGHFLAPDDVAVIYDLNPLYGGGFDGTGLRIVIPGQSRVDLTDINSFRSVFHLSPNTPQTVLAGADPGTVPDALGEADLDLEWAGAVARGATLIYVYSTDVVVATQCAINQNLAPIISWSYGSCEVQNSPGARQFFRSLAQQAAAQGITWVASSGDSGPADCDAHGDPSHPIATQGISASLPASVPEVTGVGGTRFNEGGGNYWNSSNGANSGSALSYIPETSWNDSAIDGALSASGGGASIAFAKPVWQSAPGVPNDGARDVPDVSLSASGDHDGYAVCTGGSCAGNWPPQQLWVFGGNLRIGPGVCRHAGAVTAVSDCESFSVHARAWKHQSDALPPGAEFSVRFSRRCVR
jgi:subtilase family serine protease